MREKNRIRTRHGFGMAAHFSFSLELSFILAFWTFSFVDKNKRHFLVRFLLCILYFRRCLFMRLFIACADFIFLWWLWFGFFFLGWVRQGSWHLNLILLACILCAFAAFHFLFMCFYLFSFSFSFCFLCICMAWYLFGWQFCVCVHTLSIFLFMHKTYI